MGFIQKQGIQNALITYTGVLIGFVSLMFIQPNFLTAEELGLTRILIAAATLIATIVPMGAGSVTTKFFPYFRNPEKRHYGYFGFMLLFPLVGTLICGGLIFLFSDLIMAQYVKQSPLFTQFFHVLLPLALLMAMNMVLNSYCSSLYRTVIISLFEGVVTRLLFILIIFLYFYEVVTLEQFVYLFVCIYLLQMISMMIFLRIIDKPSFKIDRAHLASVGVSKLITFGLLFALTNVSSLSLRHLDAVMIAKYIDLNAVGIFAVASYIAYVIEIPLASLERVSHAKVSQGWANNDIESIRRIYSQSVKYLMLGGGFLTVGIIVNVTDLLSLLPEVYQQGDTVTVIACTGAFLNIATGMNTSILFTSDKYKYGVMLLVLLLVMVVSLNQLLIPAYGIEGAAVATMLASVIYNVLKYFLILKHFKMQPYNSSSLKTLMVIFLSLGVGLLCPSFSNAILSMLVRSAAVTIVFFGMTYALRIVPEFHKFIPFVRK
ncbi:MAG: polysaccharide biosynthesis C-terminal domain-containing protein [Bacteroidota bacterium]|nr:polysaccharide biosynthesis C-terminal domain-containing protein [Bacteroidota bacterium]